MSLQRPNKLEEPLKPQVVLHRASLRTRDLERHERQPDTDYFLATRNTPKMKPEVEISRADTDPGVTAPQSIIAAPARSGTVPNITNEVFSKTRTKDNGTPTHTVEFKSGAVQKKAPEEEVLNYNPLDSTLRTRSGKRLARSALGERIYQRRLTNNVDPWLTNDTDNSDKCESRRLDSELLSRHNAGMQMKAAPDYVTREVLDLLDEGIDPRDDAERNIVNSESILNRLAERQGLNIDLNTVMERLQRLEASVISEHASVAMYRHSAEVDQMSIVTDLRNDKTELRNLLKNSEDDRRSMEAEVQTSRTRILELEKELAHERGRASRLESENALLRKEKLTMSSELRDASSIKRVDVSLREPPKPPAPVPYLQEYDASLQRTPVDSPSLRQEINTLRPNPLAPPPCGGSSSRRGRKKKKPKKERVEYSLLRMV